MKLTEKYRPSTVQVPHWKVYVQCSPILGEILDDKFEKQLDTYEHIRHSASEVFNHPDYKNVFEVPLVDANESIYGEERRILSLLTNGETTRRVNIIGDVGVGKTTFLRHLRDVHLGREPFPASKAIYIEFSDFTASLADPIPAIHTKFVDSVLAALSQSFDRETLFCADNQMFESAAVFGRYRVAADRKPNEKERCEARDRAIEEVVLKQPLDFVFARINQLCVSDRNALIILVDNIDHLPRQILDHIFQFLIQVQLSTKPLLIAAMRDHTAERGKSSYAPESIVTPWQMRLRPPNVKLVLERRSRFFFADDRLADPSEIEVGGGLFQRKRDVQIVCRTLLQAPFSDPDTYEFLSSYANFNLRDLFSIVGRIVGSPGFAGFDATTFLADIPDIKIGINECLLALGLRQYLMFFPEESHLFNPYSAGADADPRDKLVGVRILQLLGNRTLLVKYAELQDQFRRWGYNPNAVYAQISSMMRKDLLWSDTGLPDEFTENSMIRLSYRGQLYVKKIMRRAIFNYMMSFDVRAPSEHHPIARHHASTFREELSAVARFNAIVDVDCIADRVLGLADVLFEAEREEHKGIAASHALEAFRAEVVPKFACVEVLLGLETFLNKVLSQSPEVTRFQAPKSALLKMIDESKTRYNSVLAIH